MLFFVCQKAGLLAVHYFAAKFRRWFINYIMAKIMVVDDSIDLLHLIGIIIKMEGHESIALASPEEITQKIEEHIPDLIILDVNIGSYDGREICKNIKADPASKNIPVLLTSASADVLIDFKEFGADDILEKPFELSTIKKKINGLLGKAVISQ
jgi:two-component system phosphate regulon response regulator PhoB